MSPSRNDGAQARDEKRARFSQQEKKKPRATSPLALAAGLLIAVALLAGAALALKRSPSTRSELAPSNTAPVADSSSNGAVADDKADPPRAATAGHDPYPLVTAENGAAALPVSTFDDGLAHHYTYMHEGEPIEFFVMKSKDGVIRAAFNACDVCFPAHLGYRQEGDDMVCNNCGRHFPADQINIIEGGCNPSPLDRTTVGGTLGIGVNDLAQGLKYFED